MGDCEREPFVPMEEGSELDEEEESWGSGETGSPAKLRVAGGGPFLASALGGSLVSAAQTELFMKMISTGSGGDAPIIVLETKRSLKRRPSSVRRALTSALPLKLRASFAISEDEETVETDRSLMRCKPGGLAALCSNTHFSRREIQLMYRGFKEGCPTGLISEEELREIFAQFFPASAPAAYASAVFNMFDIDANGQISFDEFVYGVSILSRGSAEEKLSWLFRLYDADRDGLLSRPDLHHVVQGMYLLCGPHANPPVSEAAVTEHVEYLAAKLGLEEMGPGLSQADFVKACQDDRHLMASFHAFV